MNFLLIAISGALGASIRAVLQLGLLSYSPLGTLLANFIGCFLAGFFSLFVQQAFLKQILLVGLCGALTTLSSLCMETLNFWQVGRFFHGMMYFIGSASLGLVFCFLGMKAHGLIFHG